MPRRHSILSYVGLYALIFVVVSAAYVGVVRLFAGWLGKDPILWLAFSGLALVLIGPAYVVGRKFVKQERRGITRKEGVWLSIAMAFASLVVTFAGLSVSETLSNNNSRAWIGLFTSFRTVPAFMLFSVGYSIAAALPMGLLLWFANRRAVRRLEDEIDDTFA